MSRTGKQSRTGDGIRSEDGDLKMKGQEGHSASGGGIKTVKRRTVPSTIINLSHLEEEEEDT